MVFCLPSAESSFRYSHLSSVVNVTEMSQGKVGRRIIQIVISKQFYCFVIKLQGNSQKLLKRRFPPNAVMNLVRLECDFVGDGVQSDTDMYNPINL